ncbi:hypothetical protein LXA43DRAFT_1104880 [Ganoderma leucocontextum]|nr:hypothetical protein LXA43DRAFT_1104880 [Ganoderma leucocontextum]
MGPQQVLCAFDDAEFIHVEGDVDPCRDMDHLQSNMSESVSAGARFRSHRARPPFRSLHENGYSVSRRGRHHAPFAPAFSNTVEYLTKQTAIDLGLDDEFAVSLSWEESLIAEQLRVERDRTTALKAQMEEIWKYETAAAYELTSVFIHRGPP